MTPATFTSSTELPHGGSEQAWAALVGCSTLDGETARLSDGRHWAWTARLLDADHDEREANFAIRARARDRLGYVAGEMRAAIAEGNLVIESRTRATGAVDDEDVVGIVLEAVTAALRRTVADTAAGEEVDGSPRKAAPVVVARNRERDVIRLLLLVLGVLLLLERYVGRRS